MNVCNGGNAKQSCAPARAFPGFTQVDGAWERTHARTHGRACERAGSLLRGEPLSPPLRSPHFLLSPAASGFACASAAFERLAFSAALQRALLVWLRLRARPSSHVTDSSHLGSIGPNYAAFGFPNNAAQPLLLRSPSLLRYLSVAEETCVYARARGWVHALTDSCHSAPPPPPPPPPTPPPTPQTPQKPAYHPRPHS